MLLILIYILVYLVLISLVPALILGGLVYLFDPGAAIYTAVAAFGWKFVEGGFSIKVMSGDIKKEVR